MKKSNGVGRRGFLKTVGLAGLAAEEKKAGAQTGARANTARTRAASQAAQVEYPRNFTGPQLAMIAFPWAASARAASAWAAAASFAIGRFSISPIRAARPAMRSPPSGVRQKRWRACSKRASCRPMKGPRDLGSANVPGLPRLAGATLPASSRWRASISRMPTCRCAWRSKRSLRSSRMMPTIPDCRWPCCAIACRTGPRAQRKVGDRALHRQSRRQRGPRQRISRQARRSQGLLMRNPFLAATDPLAGSFALAVLGRGDGKVTYLRGWRGGTRWRVGPLIFWDDFSADGELGPEAPVKDAVGSLCLKRDIPAQRRAEFTFLLSWHFPNRTPAAAAAGRRRRAKRRRSSATITAPVLPMPGKRRNTPAAKLPELEKRTRRLPPPCARPRCPPR